MADTSVRRVLVVDDEPAVRGVVAVAFELEGYEVAQAEDGADGIVQCELFHPDVVVMDIMMPRIDGLTALGHLRQQPETADVPVLLLSAKAQSADIAIGMRVGADDYVTKPFDVDDLLERARKVIEMPAAERPHRLVAVAPVGRGLPRPEEVPPSRRPDPPRPAPAPSQSAAVDGGLAARSKSAMTGVAVFAVATLAVVAVGLGVVAMGRSPSIWAGVLLEVVAVAVAVVVSRWATQRRPPPVARPTPPPQAPAQPRAVAPAFAAGAVTATVLAASRRMMVSGTARVCASPEDAEGRIGLGDILVIDDPTPAYNIVAPLLGGLVTERGGASSHAAIMAREFGIPAVVDATNACTTIRDGQDVILDPVAGTVRPAPVR